MTDSAIRRIERNAGKSERGGATPPDPVVSRLDTFLSNTSQKLGISKEQVAATVVSWLTESPTRPGARRSATNPGQ